MVGCITCSRFVVLVRSSKLKVTKETLERRIEGNYKVGLTGCWSWFGTTSAAGYATMIIDGTRYMVRRLMFYHFTASPSEKRLMKDRSVKSICGTPNCINPEHMKLTKVKKRGRG